MSDAVPRQSDETVWPEVRDDRLCDRFEYLLKAGQGVEVHDFLRAEGLDPADHPDLAAHLGRVEAHYRADGETRVVGGESAVGPTDVRPGAVFDGKYTLIKSIGEGGMGEVWAARQSRPIERLVAVKVIKPGMDSRAVLARFDAERQALAVMDHPNIARVYDAGSTPAGRPYFVMELVKGVSITKFCDAHTLTPKRRMALFVTACEAIQHAHLKGVIHRDIKPSNVLVALTDGQPVVKVIDFGIAKAIGEPLTEHTFVTGQGAVIGTPEYMSPEQAGLNPHDIDTRSDVYSLGVLLYELLTGTTPIDCKSLRRAVVAEVLRMVREVDAPRPSEKLSSSADLPGIAATRGTEPKRLPGEFRGEVDWILLKALEKDRGRRYGSANAFAADVQRHLNSEVVEARPPTPGYKLRKFVRRNRGPVAAAAAVLVTLFGGVIGTSVGLIEAMEARGKEAERAEGELRAKRLAVEAGDAAFRTRYGSDVRLVQRFWEDGRYAAAGKLLDRQRPEVTGGTDYRGFEWHFWRRRLSYPQQTFRPLSAVVLVSGAAVSGDGTRVAMVVRADDAGRVVVYDRRTEAEVFARPLTPAGKSAETVIALTDDGSRLAVAEPSQPVVVWDVTAQKRVSELPAVARPSRVEFSRDGRRVLLAGRPDRPPPGVVNPPAMRLGGPPDKVTFAAFDTDTGRLSSPGSDKRGPRLVSLFPSGDRVAAVVAGNTGAARVVVWELDGWKEVMATPLTAPPTALAVSPDGRFVSVGCEVLSVGVEDDSVTLASTTATVRTFEVASGRRVSLGRYTDGWQKHRGLTFHPDGKQLLGWPITGRPRVFDIRTGDRTDGLTGRDEPLLVARYTGSGGDVVGVYRDATISTWEVGLGLESRIVLRDVDGPDPLTVAFDTDGTRLLTAFSDGTVRVTNVSSGETTTTLVTPDRSAVAAGFLADPNHVLVATPTQFVCMDAKTGKELRRWVAANPDPKLKRTLRAVSFDPTGVRVAAEWDSGRVKVWSDESGAEVVAVTLSEDGKANPVAASAFSPTGSQLVAVSDRELVLADAASGNTTGRIPLPVGFGPTSVVFAPDGHRVAVGGQDGTARIFDLTTGREAVCLRGHTQVVTTVAFTPDGRRVVTGAGNRDSVNPPDETVRVWEAATGLELLVLHGHTYWVNHLAVSPDGFRIASAGKDWTVRVWDATPPRRSETPPEIAK